MFALPKFGIPTRVFDCISNKAFDAFSSLALRAWAHLKEKLEI